MNRWLLAMVLAACPSGAGAQGQWNFTRRTEWMPLADSAGVAIAQPFLGGFDVPRPQLIDIDADGDHDLFVQEREGALMFFESAGGRYTWKTDRFQELDVGEWYRFVDLDRDGDLDLMGELRNSHIRVWRNEGSRSAARFVAMPDSLRDVNGKPIFADQQNILNTVDIDCNGKLDLFIGRVSGTIDRYEEDGHAPDGMLRFRFLTERWENIEIIGTAQVGGSAGFRPSMHGANTMAFADVDEDGDPELYWGDFFEPGLLRIDNRGTCARPDLQGTPVQFPAGDALLTSGYNAPTFADADGDGDLDLVMGVIGGAFQPSRTAIGNLYFVEQSAKGTFEVRTSRLVRTVDVGSESSPVLADVDGDGDLDLLVGNKISTDDSNVGTLTYLENVGSRSRPSFRDRGRAAGDFEYHPSPAVVDLDGDGKPELVTGTWRDRLRVYRNRGGGSAPAWEAVDTALVVLTRGSNTAPTFGDLDGDGDLDLIVGEASGELNLYRNVGSRTSPKFELVSDNFQQIDTGRRSTPTLADLTGDGRLDLLLGGEEGGLQLWRNVGANDEIRFERDPSFTVASFDLSAPAVGDIDGDGDLDLIIGVGSGGLLLYENGTPRK